MEVGWIHLAQDGNTKFHFRRNEIWEIYSLDEELLACQ